MVRSVLPKLSPVTVTDAMPVCGTLIRALETTAPSKVMPVFTLVPAIAATVSRTGSSICGAADVQCTVVEDVQADVRQCMLNTCTEVVKSAPPKCRPLTVTAVAPLPGTFKNATEARGASYVNRLVPVPATAPIVMIMDGSVPWFCFAEHPRAVPDSHESVSHSSVLSSNVGVKSAAPKFKPVTVIDFPVVKGRFAYPFEELVGASNENLISCVPDNAPTVTMNLLSVESA